MKVGILTFSEVDNFGAMLQAYALQESVASLGHSVELIRYPRRPHSLLRLRRVYRYRRNVGQYLRALRADATYRGFRRRYYRCSRCCSSVAELRDYAAGFDAVIVGSDQVWSSAHASIYGEDSIYFLSFLPDAGIRKISYAASVGSRNDAHTNDVTASRWLPEFYRIGVREEYSREIVHGWSKRSDIAVVADPTVLHDFSHFVRPRKYNLPKEFILVYPVPKDGIAIGQLALDRLREQTELPVVAIVCTNHVDFEFPGADLYVRAASPCDFVALFARANCVLTNSFHGTIFALKYQKPFTVYLNAESGSAERLYDLTARYGVRDRIVDSLSLVDEVVPRVSPDRLEASLALMGTHAEESKQFLREALE
jgi:hypothetical protein